MDEDTFDYIVVGSGAGGRTVAARLAEAGHGVLVLEGGGDPRVDRNFRVHGCQRLRVVDASVFPRIPGLFIVSAAYMIGEKAAETILRTA